MEDLKQYFETTRGLGILSTAGAQGAVNAAVFSRPHCMEDGTVAFIMLERLTFKNLSENPHAHFLFREDGPGYQGKRLHLAKVGQETDTERLFELKKRRRDKTPEASRHLVFFRVDKVLPLVGDK